MDNLSRSNIVITDKQPCQLDANTRAIGVSERWVITFNALNTAYSQSRQETNSRVTIQKYNGEWRWFNALAFCG